MDSSTVATPWHFKMHSDIQSISSYLRLNHKLWHFQIIVFFVCLHSDVEGNRKIGIFRCGKITAINWFYLMCLLQLSFCMHSQLHNFTLWLFSCQFCVWRFVDQHNETTYIGILYWLIGKAVELVFFLLSFFCYLFFMYFKLLVRFCCIQKKLISLTWKWWQFIVHFFFVFFTVDVVVVDIKFKSMIILGFKIKPMDYVKQHDGKYLQANHRA